MSLMFFLGGLLYAILLIEDCQFAFVVVTELLLILDSTERCKALLFITLCSRA